MKSIVVVGMMIGMYTFNDLFMLTTNRTTNDVSPSTIMI